MLKILRRLLLFILLLALILAATFWFAPASLFSRILDLQQTPLRLAMVEGNLRQGSARQARWRGIDLGQVEWKLGEYRLQPPAVRLDFKSSGPQMRLKGQASWSGDTIDARDLNGHFPARWLDLKGLGALVAARGEVQLDLQRLRWSRSQTPLADGHVVWRDAGLEGMVNADLGDIDFELRPDGMGNTRVEFSNRGSPDLEIRGSISLSGNQYRLDALARSGNPRIERFLRQSGQATADGGYRLRLNGLISPE